MHSNRSITELDLMLINIGGRPMSDLEEGVSRGRLREPGLSTSAMSVLRGLASAHLVEHLSKWRMTRAAARVVGELDA